MVLQAWGYETTSLDSDPKRDPSICIDILEWDYRAVFQPGDFQIVTASPPCTEYSLAKSRGPRDLEGADRIVKRTLEIIEYLRPDRWWLETPRSGWLARRDFMQQFHKLDCDHC